jgi:predicted transcriptional regulator
MEKRVMTLALNDREMQILDELAERQGLTKVGVIRQALRAYQLLEERANQGQKLFIEDPLTKEKTELALLVA